MMIDNYIIIGICTLIILSYFFSLIAEFLRVPSVLLLLATGCLIRYAVEYYGFDFEMPDELLRILGTTGLILIVLEGTLDIKFAKNKIPILKASFLVSFLVLVLSSILLALPISYYAGCDFFSALLYSIPLSVISSAIVIPSVIQLEEKKREFMIYESTFSDILGILLFNFFAFIEYRDSSELTSFGVNVAATVVISLVFTVLLIWAIEKITTKVKIYLILSIVILVYSLGKLFHLPSLMLVMFFGLALNNIEFFAKRKVEKYFDIDKIQGSLQQFKPMIFESSFVIRTLFFVIFGYSLNLSDLFDLHVLEVGIILSLLIYMLRFINLKFFTGTGVFPEILIAPRGLITILLYYSIPAGKKVAGFNDGVLYFVIILSALIMSLGLMFTQKEKLADRKINSI